MEARRTVYFDDSFWVGVFERMDGERLSACRIPFGAEPKDCEAYDFVLKCHADLSFSQEVIVGLKKTANHPKPRQR